MNTKAKALVVTGLAIVGAVSVLLWLRKPKKNDEGFYNADGCEDYKSCNGCNFSSTCSKK